jgi:riboflavin kinase / FMN adenylyltransferase
MHRLFGGAKIPEPFRGGIIALGNFDGFHLGHQAVVGHAIERAHAAGRPALIATFDPHPVSYFRPGTPPFRLTTLDQRQTLFAKAGADAMLVFAFDAALAGVEADAFITEWLIDAAGAAGVVTGEDYTFGKARGGSIEMLKTRGAELGLSCETVGPVSDTEGAISSSRIRQALQAGDCASATRLLTRPFAIEGVVQHGDKLGRTIGYPTANIALADYLRPRYGIYAARARLADGRVVDGAANIGIRPSFDPPKELLEVFLFDFNESLYDQRIEVELHAFLRPEAKFDSLEELTAQMDKDCAAARAILGADRNQT